MITHPIALGIAVFFAIFALVLNAEFVALPDKDRTGFRGVRIVIFLWTLFAAIAATTAVWE